MATLGNVTQSDGVGKVMILVKDKLAFTPDGGLAMKLINKTGGNSVKGTVGAPYSASAINNAFTLIPNNEPDPIGIIYGDDDGNSVADGVACWVVFQGKAKVYFENASVRGNFARVQVDADGGTIGYAIHEAFPTAPFATDKHFLEIGHVLESTGGAGLADCSIHFN
jgi:hypothetical protein